MPISALPYNYCVHAFIAIFCYSIVSLCSWASARDSTFISFSSVVVDVVPVFFPFILFNIFSYLYLWVPWYALNARIYLSIYFSDMIPRRCFPSIASQNMKRSKSVLLEHDSICIHARFKRIKNEASVYTHWNTSTPLNIFSAIVGRFAMEHGNHGTRRTQKGKLVFLHSQHEQNYKLKWIGMAG